MRSLAYLSLLVVVATSTASAQTQTTVDIMVSTPKYSDGIVEARVTRKDPAEKMELIPGMTVRVTIALKGEKPFFSKDLVLKQGGYETVQAAYRGEANALAFTVSAFALEMKELVPEDNTRTSEATVEPAPSPAPAPAPSPSPAPAPPPSGGAFTTPQLVITGGASGTPRAVPAGATMTTPSLILLGGAPHAPASLPTGANITTPQLVLIGRRD